MLRGQVVHGKKHRPDFFATYFELADAMCHFYMPFAPPQRKDVTDEDRRRLNGGVVGLIERGGLDREALLSQLRQLVDSNAARDS